MSSSSEPAKSAPRDKLTLAFAVIGAAGGGLVGHMLSGGHRMGDRSFSTLITVSTAAVAALLGRMLERQLAGLRWSERYTRTIFGALLAGGVNACVLFLVVIIASGRMPPAVLLGVPLAAIFGAVVAVAFLIPLCLVVRASATANDARVGSIAFDSRRRAVWRTVAGSLAVACLLAVPAPRGTRLALLHHWPTQLTIVCIVTVAILTALELFEVRRAKALRTESARLEIAPDPSAIPRSVPRLVDYGLGGEVRAETAPGPLAYRATDEIRRIALGDPSRAMRDLRRGALFGAAALVLCGFVLVCELAAAAKQPSKASAQGMDAWVDAHAD